MSLYLGSNAVQVNLGENAYTVEYTQKQASKSTILEEPILEDNATENDKETTTK